MDLGRGRPRIELDAELRYAVALGETLMLGDGGSAEVAGVARDKRSIWLTSLVGASGDPTGVSWESPLAAMRELETGEDGSLRSVTWHAVEWTAAATDDPHALCGFPQGEGAGVLTPLPPHHWRRVDLGGPTDDADCRGERCAACLRQAPLPAPWGDPA